MLRGTIYIMKEAAEWWNSLSWDEQCHYAWEHYQLKPEGLGILEIMKIHEVLVH